jgi:UDP-N-acetylglucosamine--dolichyl-phosphate N-acetylglucosaminephosphotransferase
MESVVIVCVLSFLATLWAAPKAMKYLKGCGIVGIDQQKKGKPVLPTSGGLAVAFGLLAGIMVYIGLSTFVITSPADMTVLLAAASAILVIVLVGILDDLNVKGDAKPDRSGTVEYRVGLKQWVKPLLTLPAAIPLMVISAGESIITPPFIGPINTGLLYPLILVPIAVVCVSNVNNMLAGLNGLETGLGFLASLSVGMYALFFGRIEGAIIGLGLAAALLAFLRYNWYPARVLPGDSLTYLIGAAFVTAAIAGNVEFFAIIVYIPWIMEALLKLRGRFAVASIGILQPNGRLRSRYKKVYSLTHIFQRTGRFTERQIVEVLMLVEVVFCLLAFLVSFLVTL